MAMRLKKPSNPDIRSAGFDVGKFWVEDVAEPDEVRPLRKFVGENGGVPADQLFPVDSTDYTMAERLYFRIEPENDGDRSEAFLFWDFLAVNEIYHNDADYIGGFIEGAMSVK